VEHAEVSRTPASPEVRVGEASEVVEWLAADLEESARHASSEGRRFTLAIPGGSVATRCFPRLAMLSLDWSGIDLFWVDERAVPPTHAESNYGLAMRLWLEPAKVPAERIHRMPGEARDLAGAARDYGAELTRHAGSPPRLDYVLLGVGSDGHAASLFPGHPELRETEPALAIANAPVPPSRRLSLSLPALSHARRVAIVAFGGSKAKVIRECLDNPDSTLPVARVARQAERCVFLLDEAASGR
jgi:6-phosphogluconolactonase